MSGRGIALAVMGALLVAGSAVAAEPQGPPMPGPEHKKLEHFVGSWSGKAEMKPSPFGPGGSMTWSETCRLYEGGFALVCDAQGAGPRGRTQEHSLMTYDSGEKQYRSAGVSSLGEVWMSTCTVEGETWACSSEQKMEGKTVRSRFTLSVISPASHSFKWEVSTDGGPWTLVTEGTATKAK